MTDISIFVAFTAGLLAFLSPCVLPLVPAYIAYLSGAAVQQVDLNALPSGAGSSLKVAPVAGQAIWRRMHVFLHALAFVFGFAIIFSLLGLGLSFVSSLRFLQDNREVVRWVAGGLLIIFGLHSLTMINIPFLNLEKRLEVNANPALGYFSSTLVGMGFAVGWTPCVGAVLGSIFSLILSDPHPNLLQDGLLLFSFALGLGVPFLVASLGVVAITGLLRRLTARGLTWRLGNWLVFNNLNVVSAVSGVFLILMGFFIATNQISQLNQFFNFLPTNGLS